MKTALWACIHAAALLALPSAALGADPWSLEIVQGGKTIKADGKVELEKKPFKLVFTGKKGLGYGILGSVACAEIVPLKDAAAIGGKIRPTNIGAESRNRQENTTLIINNTKAVAEEDNTAQLWSDEQGMYSFQSVAAQGDGAAVATREITKIFFYTNFKESREYSIESVPFESACMLVTALPPVGRMAHTYPKQFEIRFR